MSGRFLPRHVLSSGADAVTAGRTLTPAPPFPKGATALASLAPWGRAVMSAHHPVLATAASERTAGPTRDSERSSATRPGDDRRAARGQATQVSCESPRRQGALDTRTLQAAPSPRTCLSSRLLRLSLRTGEDSARGGWEPRVSVRCLRGGRSTARLAPTPRSPAQGRAAKGRDPAFLRRWLRATRSPCSGPGGCAPRPPPSSR